MSVSSKVSTPRLLSFKRFWIALATPAIFAYIISFGISDFISHFFNFLFDIPGIIGLIIILSIIPSYIKQKRKYLSAKTSERKAPGILTVKSLWVACVIIPGLVYLANHNNADAVLRYFWYWSPISLIIFLLALPRHLHRCNSVYSYDNFNDNNDGIYSHEFRECLPNFFGQKQKYLTSMVLNANTRTIKLQSDGHEKTYSFDDIKSWRCKLPSALEMVGSDATGLIQSLFINQGARNRALEQSGFFIKVSDIQFPEWRVKFYPTEGWYHEPEGYRNMEMQMDRWMEVFDQVVNK